VRPKLGRLVAGRLTLAREGIDAGRRATLLLREGLTRGFLTTAVLDLDRGTELVSVGAPPERPTTLVAATEPERPTVLVAATEPERPTVLVAATEPGGRWTTVVRAGVVRARLTESTRLVLGRVRVTVPVRRLGARATVWVRAGLVRERPTEPVGLTTPRPERVAGGLARTVVGR
jgi:hypothetical protein